MEQRQVQLMLADRSSQVAPMRRRCELDRAQLLTQTVKCGQAFSGRGYSLIGEVIGGAGEAINRAHCGPQSRGHQPRRNRKVFIVSNAHGVEAITASYAAKLLQR